MTKITIDKPSDTLLDLLAVLADYDPDLLQYHLSAVITTDPVTAAFINRLARKGQEQRLNTTPDVDLLDAMRYGLNDEHAAQIADGVMKGMSEPDYCGLSHGEHAAHAEWIAACKRQSDFLNSPHNNRAEKYPPTPSMLKFMRRIGRISNAPNKRPGKTQEEPKPDEEGGMVIPAGVCERIIGDAISWEFIPDYPPAGVLEPKDGQYKDYIRIAHKSGDKTYVTYEWWKNQTPLHPEQKDQYEGLVTKDDGATWTWQTVGQPENPTAQSPIMPPTITPVATWADWDKLKSSEPEPAKESDNPPLVSPDWSKCVVSEEPEGVIAVISPTALSGHFVPVADKNGNLTWTWKADPEAAPEADPAPEPVLSTKTCPRCERTMQHLSSSGLCVSCQKKADKDPNDPYCRPPCSKCKRQTGTLNAAGVCRGCAGAEAKRGLDKATMERIEKVVKDAQEKDNRPGVDLKPRSPRRFLNGRKF